jgi:hypothetical protein
VGLVQVQPAHVGGALEELGVVGAVEPSADQVGLEVKVGQDPSDLGGGDQKPVVVQALGDQLVGPLAVDLGRWVATIATMASRSSWP